MHLLKTSLKILGAFVVVGLLGLGVAFAVFMQDEALRCDTVPLSGRITPDTFVEFRGCLARSHAPNKTVVVGHSEGGDGRAALALGMLIRRHGWNVEVVDLCPSSCANFIFPAGKKKYLRENSLLLFHGGPYQANMMEMAEALDRELAMRGGSAATLTVGEVNKEGSLTYTPEVSEAAREVEEFLSMTDVKTFVGWVTSMRIESDRFYLDLGVNPMMPTYGQTGEYEELYKSYEHGGFIYRLDSLQRLGIENIELPDGEWHPERHPDYENVYEVTYP